ncbi:hypothetical protein M153_1000157772 [Pseudoloma neurophilia]|uniref:Uncharacterized protein n=1 Tax=Pseudoloma neurophilia TaxID=146866 RepID=A0A0R0M1G5_9MICR|nr:hypothetical protein M153_1000157772 [Pseudoloma neurophilia]
MEEDFIPDFTLKDQTGEIFNNLSTFKIIDDELLVSQNNFLYFWDLQSMSKINRIGCEKKKTITGFCKIDDVFCISYDDGSLLGYNYQNEKVFGRKIDKKKIISMIKRDSCVYLSTQNGFIYEFDVIKCDITKEYRKQNSCTGQMVSNDSFFVTVSGKTFIIFDFDKKDPVKFIELENQISECAIISNTLIILDLKGYVHLFNLVNLEFFESNRLNIKTARNIYFSDNFFYLISPQKKINRFQLSDDLNTVKITEKGVFTCDVSKMLTFEKNIYVFSSGNQIYKIALDDQSVEPVSLLQYHTKEILDVKISDKFVYTLSEEKLIKWQLPEYQDDDEEMKLDFINSRSFEHKMNGMCIFDSKLCMFDHQILFFICQETFQNTKTLDIENTSSIAASDDNFAVGSGREITIYNKDLEEASQILDESDVIFLRFSTTGKILGVSNLNNKINLYQTETGAQIMSLFGHSLPVRFFDFSSDDKSLLSCSTDKLIKLWGVEYGECRKTILENAEMALFMRHNKNIYLLTNDNLNYYNKNEKIKEFKNFDLRKFDFSDDFLVATSKYQINLYRMNNYEFLKELSSDFDEDLEIEDQKKFDRLENALEKYRNEETCDDLVHELSTMDLAEIDPFIKLLNHSSLLLILQLYEDIGNFSTIIWIKIFLSLLTHHRSFCQENSRVYDAYSKIFKNLEKFHHMIKDNCRELRK